MKTTTHISKHVSVSAAHLESQHPLEALSPLRVARVPAKLSPPDCVEPHVVLDATLEWSTPDTAAAPEAVRVAQARGEFLAQVLDPNASTASICGEDEPPAAAIPPTNIEAAGSLTAHRDEVFERVSEAVAHLRFPDVPTDGDATSSVVEFIDTSLDGLMLWRCGDEVQDVTDTVMLWEDELATTAPHLSGHLDALVGLAVEIALVRECFFWDDINTQLAGMSADDLTTGNADLDAWLIAYGKAMAAIPEDDSDDCMPEPAAATGALGGTPGRPVENAIVRAERLPTYGELLKLATVIVGELRLRDAAPPWRSNIAVLDYDEAARARCSAEAIQVACLVMDWQIALREDGLDYAFETATLFEIAIELVLVRRFVASEALYADLARMPSGRLTTWDPAFDAWFASYAWPRSGFDRPAEHRLTGREQEHPNDIDVIVTPFCLHESMIEQTFCPNASALVTERDRASIEALDRFGLSAYNAAGRLVARRGVCAAEARSGNRMSGDVRLQLDGLFVCFALSIGDIDQPPLACVMLDERYRSWFFDVFLPECCPSGLAAAAEAVYDGAVEWLWQLRVAGGCCSSGCST